MKKQNAPFPLPLLFSLPVLQAELPLLNDVLKKLRTIAAEDSEFGTR